MTFGVSALVLGSAAIGTAMTQGSIAFAGVVGASNLAKQAAADANKGYRALAAHQAVAAIAFAEAAVRAAPQDAGYRALLGQAYLQSGRFASARDAFIDTLALSPNDGRSALSLALAQIASGDWATARKTLDDHADLIPVVDRGLALALAGDPAGAVDMLNVAARAPGADAKARQNLALALALAGHWEESRSVAAIDVSPADLDQRMIQWASFARPQNASDQVASLLGVKAVADPGQPVALALNGQVPAQATASIDRFMPGQMTAPAEQVAEAAPPAPTPVEAPTEAPAVQVAANAIVFGERQEVVQRLPVSTARRVAAKAVAKPALQPVAAPVMAPAKGNFYVQLGAYDNANTAHDGWIRASRAFAKFADHTPSGMTVSTRGGTFYRLSVGGFARADAVSMCLAYRGKGGNCFVREAAGDKVATWVSAGKQLASR